MVLSAFSGPTTRPGMVRVRTSEHLKMQDQKLARRIQRLREEGSDSAADFL